MLDQTETLELETPPRARADVRREIEAALRESPHESNRALAAKVGVDEKSVRNARARLAEAGEIPQSDSREASRAPAEGAEFPTREAALLSLLPPGMVDNPEFQDSCRRVAARAAVDPITDWWRDNAGAVVVQFQSALAVYRNDDGDIVIREQSRDLDDDQDHFVVVRPENLPALIAALQRLAP